MKKINVLYFVLLTLLWPGVDRLLSVYAQKNPAWLLLLPAYICWYVLSAPLFYIFRKRKGIRKDFLVSRCMSAQWATIWIDLSGREFAYLCMLNPFRIHYLPLDAVSNARAEVRYTRDKSYIHFVNCSFDLNGRHTKIRVETSGRGHLLHAASNGKKVVDETQQFADLLNGQPRIHA